MSISHSPNFLSLIRSQSYVLSLIFVFMLKFSKTNDSFQTGFNVSLHGAVFCIPPRTDTHTHRLSIQTHNRLTHRQTNIHAHTHTNTHTHTHTYTHTYTHTHTHTHARTHTHTHTSVKQFETPFRTHCHETRHPHMECTRCVPFLRRPPLT